MSGFDLSTLQRAELAVLRERIDAMMADTAPRLPVAVGDRVCFTYSDATFYGVVDELFQSAVDGAQAWIAMDGGAWRHREPLGALRRVCGSCDCTNRMTHRPRCCS